MSVLRKKIELLRFEYIRKPIKKKKIFRLIKNLRPKHTEKELIRVGGSNDGGYLIPNDLENLAACFSPGTGDITNFENDCANLGMKIFMADGSVENPVVNDDRFHFIKKYVGAPGKANFLTLEDWISNSGIESDSDLLLQMDIEGHEYDALNFTSVETLSRFRIIVVEFHGLHSLWDDSFFKEADKSFSKLLKNHFCVHIHPNNCCEIKNVGGFEIPSVAEFTFIRTDRVKDLKKINFMPHKLDEDNTDNESITLPRIWY